MFEEFNEPDISKEDIIKIIKDGGFIWTKSIKDYEEHKAEDPMKPVEIDDDGDISVEINNKLYYTKLKYVYKISFNENLNENLNNSHNDWEKLLFDIETPIQSIKDDGFNVEFRYTIKDIDDEHDNVMIHFLNDWDKPYIIICVNIFIYHKTLYTQEELKTTSIFQDLKMIRDVVKYIGFKFDSIPEVRGKNFFDIHDNIRIFNFRITL